MKKINTATIYSLILIMLLTFCLVGCGNKSGSTIDEPEITSEYLTGEYAQQLLTDGAETITGYVDILDTDGVYALAINEQKVVANESYENGYYIADTNIEKNVTIHANTRIVCQHDDEAVVTTFEEFLNNHHDYDEFLFTAYIINDTVELLLYTDPEDLI